MTIYEEIVQLTGQITMVEKVHLLGYLSAALKHDLEIEAYKHMPWEQFIDLTYGSLADNPIERNQPLESDARDEIE
jgi:hypothetical protein